MNRSATVQLKMQLYTKVMLLLAIGITLCSLANVNGQSGKCLLAKLIDSYIHPACIANYPLLCFSQCMPGLFEITFSKNNGVHVIH